MKRSMLFPSPPQDERCKLAHTVPLTGQDAILHQAIIQHFRFTPISELINMCFCLCLC